MKHNSCYKSVLHPTKKSHQVEYLRYIPKVGILVWDEPHTLSEELLLCIDLTSKTTLCTKQLIQYQWQKEKLKVVSMWRTLGMGITHYGGIHYLTLIDWFNEICCFVSIDLTGLCKHNATIWGCFLWKKTPGCKTDQQWHFFFYKTFKTFVEVRGIHLYF